MPKELLSEYSPNENMQFVLFAENGEEIDWVDPVTELYRHGKCLEVVNPYGTYTFKLKPEQSYSIRKREE